MRSFNPAGVAAPIGKFSHVTVVPAGRDLAFISGQIGADASGKLVGDNTFDQTIATFANLEKIIHELGCVPGDIAKMLTLVVGAEGFVEFARARDIVFARWFPDSRYPAHSAATVAALASPGLLVEIEAVVAVPR
ncbi:RidA family protein [Nocardia panacis]|uniref:RidA family protein n=1 Tax=Nocardia panacis TaxID=2340916 RepID=A0A3A4JZJ7_9NOCA|nr:RidA family protein [Nocardia panacis]RJO70096.1 RidA family protein [Nocardia panacis]